jgi:hypothetical protein
MTCICKQRLEPPLSLEGKLAPNNILDKAEEIILDREFQGPESTAGRNDDEIFTGFVGGELVRINKDGKSKTIAKMGKGNKCGTIFISINSSFNKMNIIGSLN